MITSGDLLPEVLAWLLYLVIVVVLSRGGHGRVAFVIGVGAALGATAQGLLLGDVRGAICVGVSAVAGLAAWFANRELRREVARVDAEEAALARRAAALSVRAEELRIARDLHDGIGAHLAALLWRAQRVAREAGPTLAPDVRRLQDLAGRALAELRSTVWALHSPTRAWPEALDYLRSRLADREAASDPDQAVVVEDLSGPEAAAREVSSQVVQQLLRELLAAPPGPVAVALGLDGSVSARAAARAG